MGTMVGKVITYPLCGILIDRCNWSVNWSVNQLSLRNPDTCTQFWLGERILCHRRHHFRLVRLLVAAGLRHTGNAPEDFA